MRISAFLSFNAFPALKMNGTPAQRGLFTKQRIAAKVGVLVSLFLIVSSSVYPIIQEVHDDILDINDTMAC